MAFLLVPFALAAPMEPPPPPSGELPRLESVPDGVYNSARDQLVAQRERMQPLTERIRELRRQIEEQPRQHAGNRRPLGDSSAISDLRAELHVTIDALVEEFGRVRALVETEVVPHLDAMVAEVDTELATRPADDPERAPLGEVRQLLQAMASNPEAIMRMFEVPGPIAREESPSNGGPLFGRRLARRISDLEMQQRRLLEQIERHSAEIERLRAALDQLSPEEIEQIEQSMTHDGGSWRRGRPRREGGAPPSDAPPPPQP